MGATPDLITARFVVYVQDRRDHTATRRLVVDREPGTVTTNDQAAAYVTEILGGTWTVGTILPVAESARFVHVLDALDAITQPAPLAATIPQPACPGGVRCECHDEGHNQ